MKNSMENSKLNNSKLRNAIEAILFHSTDPLSLSDIAKILRVEISLVQKAIHELIQDYENRGGAVEIVRIGNKFMMRVKPEYTGFIENFVERYLDRGTLRTLAVIAVKQPITLSKLAKIRGNKCYDHVKKLKEIGFIRAEKVKGQRSTILTTTEDFATYFGLQSTDPEEIKNALRNYYRDLLEFG
jgi:segregation and condensation protein B